MTAAAVPAGVVVQTGSTAVADASPRGLQRLLHRFVKHVGDTALDLYASALVFVHHTITLETLLLVAVAVGVTNFFCRYEYDGRLLSANVNWVFFSFAVVFPLTFSLSEAFRRRDAALPLLATFKANVASIGAAHRDWDWATKAAAAGGRAALPAGHAEEVRRVLCDMCDSAGAFLESPTVTRMRHATTPAGVRARRLVERSMRDDADRVTAGFARLSAAAEELKAAGLPGNEAARLRQYCTFAAASWEGLAMLKHYRTPLMTRAFSRVFMWVHPFMMGPYYAYIARGPPSDGGSAGRTNVAFACWLSAVAALALSSLFNIRYRLEDPFVRFALDGVHVWEELADLKRTLGARAARGAPLFDDDAGCARERRSGLSTLTVELESAHVSFAAPAVADRV